MPNHQTDDELLPEYDSRKLFEGAERGKYAEAYRQMASVVMLDPDVLAVFPDAKSVNDALRLVIELRKIGGRPRRRIRKAA